jgi:hypothetical protein
MGYRTEALISDSGQGQGYVRFEVFTAVAMKNAVFWNVTPCGSCKNRRVGGTYRLHCQGGENQQQRRNKSQDSNSYLLYNQSLVT